MRVETFTLGNSVTILDPACSLNTPNITVTLPKANVSALKGVGSTANGTPFSIDLTCSSGATLDIQLDASSVVAGTTSVITNTGTAAGVGVQLVDKTFVPVTFGSPKLVGATPSGALSIGYYARYYATTAAAGPGSVSATATFILSYQ